MPFELYKKPGYGRRIRFVTSTAGMKHLLGNLWSSLGAALPPAPTVTTLPSVAGSGKVGEVLTATGGVYTGSPTVTGQWYAGTTPISGATAKTYTPAAGDVGKTVAYEETATNAGGNIKGRSNDKTIIA